MRSFTNTAITRNADIATPHADITTITALMVGRWLSLEPEVFHDLL